MADVFAKEQVLESATKKKRGRPKKYSDDLKNGLAGLYPNVSDRTLINLTFATRGLDIAEEFLGKEEADRKFLNPSDNRYYGYRAFKYQGFLEQVGRMSDQDGASKYACEGTIEKAIELIDSGITAKKT